MTIIIALILLLSGIGVLVLIHVCIVGSAFRRRFNDNNNNNTVERGSLESTSMSRDDIEKLPSFDFKERAKGSNPLDCSVCLENFKKGDKCRLLPICKHSFHTQCVDLWLLKTPFCPICRTNNGAWRVGSEESSLFSESGYLNENNLGLEGQSGHFSEASPELEGQNGHFSEVALDSGGQSGHLSEVAVELEDGQNGNSRNLSETVAELKGNQTLKHVDFREVRAKVSHSKTEDISPLGDSGENEIG